MNHKFAVGQVVVFRPGPGEIISSQPTRATIMRLLPMQDTEYHYHIQLEADGLQRRVRENQLWAT
jgi:hypothetical protein